MTPPPISNSYWVTEDLLLASEYPGHRDPVTLREKLGKFLDAGIRSFIDLTFESELEPYAPALQTLAAERGLKVGYVRMPVRDAGLPKSPEEMRAILDRIDACFASGTPCCVHCWGGCGRTGLVVGCHLVRNGMTGANALDFLMRRWKTMAKYPRIPASPETEAQRRYILDWEPGT